MLTGVAYLADAEPGELSFLGSDKYLDQFAKTRAAAVLVQSRVNLPESVPMPVLRVPDADLAIAQVLELFAPPVSRPPPGVSPSSFIAATARVDPSCSVGPNVFIGQHTSVGAHSVLHAGVYLGDDVSVGSHCEIFPNVVVRERISIGNRVTIHAASVLGSDGFGYRWDGTKHAKIPQIGTVIIEDDVEIGSCVCIDRAKFGSTRVGHGTKIDNLIQIAHNCQIGPHCILIGQCGLAGSARLGAGVVIAGAASIRDHVTIGDGAIVTACAGVSSDVEPKAIVSGLPALPHRQALREQAALRHLPDLLRQLKEIRAEIEELKKNK